MEKLCHTLEDIKDGIKQSLNNDIIFLDEVIDDYKLISFCFNNRKIYIYQLPYYFEGFVFEYVITLHKLDKNVDQERVDLRIHVMLKSCIESVIELLNNEYKEFK